MSTTTTNHNFIKPELTDPADITAYNGNWDKLDLFNSIPIINITSTDGKRYVATKKIDITELKPGFTMIVIPNMTNTYDEKATGTDQRVFIALLKYDMTYTEYAPVYRYGSENTTTSMATPSGQWLFYNKPVMMTYDGTVFRTNLVKPSATDLFGIVPVENGGTGVSNYSALKTELDKVTDYDELKENLGLKPHDSINTHSMNGRDTGYYYLQLYDFSNHETVLGMIFWKQMGDQGHNAGVFKQVVKIPGYTLFIDSVTGQMDLYDTHTSSEAIMVRESEYYITIKKVF